MSANQAVFPIATMSRVLGVSKADFYAWLQRRPFLHAVADAALLQRSERCMPVRARRMAHPGFTRTCVTKMNGMAANGLRG